jgi:hypothetical protein
MEEPKLFKRVRVQELKPGIHTSIVNPIPRSFAVTSMLDV